MFSYQCFYLFFIQLLEVGGKCLVWPTFVLSSGNHSSCPVLKLRWVEVVWECVREGDIV